MMNVILMVVLGSNVNDLLKDRLDTAINFATNYAFNSTESYDVFAPEYNSIHWNLAGGIKYSGISKKTEAERMADYIYSYETDEANWEYYIDTDSTNTAENFVALNRFINKTGIKYSDAYVVTSNFHYNRAKKFADKIIPDNNFNWILAPMEEHDSQYWEEIHIKNVENDIRNIFKKLKIVF